MDDAIVEPPVVYVVARDITIPEIGASKNCGILNISINSPNVAKISDYDFNLKNHPSFMLKRIVEDYVVVSNYIGKILNNIEYRFISKFQ